MQYRLQEIIACAKRSDETSLETLDAMGFIPGPTESEQDYRQRVIQMCQTLDEFLGRVEKERHVTYYGLEFYADARIPESIYQKALQHLDTLWKIHPEWVPGFFSSQKMGLLFAGCAVFSLQLKLAFMFLRKTFTTNDRWLIYSRDELMAHELTHIAHASLADSQFEEFLAYQTSPNGFRRLLGGILRTPRDTYLLMGSMLTLMLLQIANITFRAPMLWWSMPAPMIAGGFCALLGGALILYLRRRQKILRAEKACRQIFDLPHGWPVIFRATWEEIEYLASHTPDEIQQQITSWQKARLRWRIIMLRFPLHRDSATTR
ncbi:MAG: hypothetical protein D6820_12295 [Lentisphaerae bacterium]|nr:MAG: hypothetical protein D6820_12295 [Lentisphaerota bacterium]